MFLLKQDSRNRKTKKLKGIILFFMSSIMLFLVGCKSDIDKINALTLSPNLPTATYTNASFEYSDSAKLQAELNTPKVHYFLNTQEPYYEFPEGIEVLFYENDKELKTIITSNYAIYKEESELFEVRDSVVVRDLKDNQTIETEQLFWEQSKKIVYSDVFTKITNENGIHYAEGGFKANQDFSYYRLNSSTGKVKFKDEEK